MIRKCGWCGKDMGTNDKGKLDQITHGICPECKAMVRQELDEMKKPALEPLDTLELIS